MGQKHKSWRRNSTKWRDITAEMFEEAASLDGDLIFQRRNLENRKHVSSEVVREAGPPNPDLPSDIIYNQILPRLPDKSLMRFKCVSKSWLSLICSPFFFAACKNFCHRRCTTNLLLHEFCGKFMSSQLDKQGYPTPVIELSDFAPSQFYWPYVQSINGLVCVAGDNRESRDYEVSIFNPTTKQCIKLPNAPMPKNNRYSPTYHFGFTPLTNKYKVLQVALDDEERLMMNIFTLGRNSSWMPRNLNPGDLPFGHQNCLLYGSLPLNGAIHWINEDDRVIVVFDVEDEKFRVIALPDLHSGSPNFFKLKGLVGIEGFVAMWGYLYGDKSLERDRKSLVIFILKGYEDDEWVTETINIESTTEDYVGDEWSFYPLCVIHTGELAVVVRPPCTSPDYDYGPSTLRLYNMKSKAFVQRWFEFPYMDNDDDSYNVYNRLGNTLVYTSFDSSFVPLQ